MVVAYALLEADPSAVESISETVAAVDGVRAVHVVAGDVDLIARIEAEDPGAVSSIVTGEIAAIDGVEDTETYLSMDG
jgi:DNA-binding Lrp family transcriptional regulator